MTRATLFSGIGMALDTIRGHKMRAVLTVLGVIIGTGAVIGVGSILAGLDGAITNILKSFGPNTLIVFKFKIGVRTGDLTPEEMRRKSLTYAKRARHHRALPVGAARQPLPVSRLAHASPRALQGQ